MPLPLLKDSRLHPAVIRHKAALAFDGINISLALQLRIRSLDGIGIDGQLCGQAAHRWKLCILRQGALKHQFPEPFRHLLIQRPAVPVIQYNHPVLPPLPFLMPGFPPAACMALASGRGPGFLFFLVFYLY